MSIVVLLLCRADMEPLSALGIASSVVTFLDFSFKLVGNAQEIYKSTTGETISSTELRIRADRLKLLTTRIEAQKNPQHYLQQPSDRSVPSALLDQCVEASSQLTSALDRAVAQRRRIWPSARNAIKGILGERQVKSLEYRLSKCCSELQLHLIANLNDGQLSLLTKINKVSHDQHRMHVQSGDRLNGLRHDINAASSCMETKVSDRIHKFSNFGEKICQMQLHIKRQQAEMAFLKSLHFPTMNARQLNIEERHERTFSWIFDVVHCGEDVKFTQWLSSNSDLFWITGKAGSGKSTMMKFISDCDDTKRYLKQWAGDCQLVTADYFFWAAGNTLQKSQEGLLRSLLFTLFQAAPDQIPPGSPVADLASPWTTRNLLDLLKRLTEDAALRTKFCFFIDGIDEYDGEPRAITQAVRALSALQNVKVCCSSRPWNAFEVELGSKTDYVLQLHEHTYRDIENFVQQALRTDELFVELEKANSQYSTMSSQLVERAQGVFLWVSLAVTGITDNIHNGDTADEIQKRIEDIPADLDDFFNRILHSIPKFYQQQSSKLLLMALEATEPLPLVATYLIIDENMDAFPDTTEDWKVKLLEMRKRLKARCLDFLEVHERKRWRSLPLTLGFTVCVVHRTVFDYLRQPHVRKILLSRAQVDLNDIHNDLCRVYLFLLKFICKYEGYGLNVMDYALVYLENLLLYARADEEQSLLILQEAERTMQILNQRFSESDQGDEWNDKSHSLAWNLWRVLNTS